MLEKLETRTLFSTFATAVQAGSVLTVNGGSSDVLVNIYETPGVDGEVTVENNGVLLGVFSGVTQVDFQGQGSSDSLFMAGYTVKYVANGNGGVDFLTISDLGTASSVVNGGGGNDDLVLLASNNTTLSGDGGDDNLYSSWSVGGATTYLRGGGGNDAITVEGGVNFIDGGGQKDTLLDNSGMSAINFITSIESIEMS